MRVAQSIGLHVEDNQGIPRGSSTVANSEMRRRTWYSIYILDHLLALQLGRPPAIHEGDFNASLPSTPDEAIPSDSTLKLGEQGDGGRFAEDYFLVMIEFSQIIGRVLRGLYSPSKAASAEDTLATIEILDQDLVRWKNRLPQKLRFEAAHTFENSIMFKRQVSTFVACHCRTICLTCIAQLSRSEVL